MTKQTLSLALAPRTRKSVAPRPPRAEYKVPRVRKDEVGIAAGLFYNYEIEGQQVLNDEQIDELEAYALRSRDTAHALVQIGWAFAKVEKDAYGEKRWFFETWMPEMKGAQENGDEMAEETEEGSRVRLNRAERNILIRSLGPMFGNGLSDELVDTVSSAIIGKRGAHIAMSLEILRVANGVESLEEVVKVIKAEASASPAPAETEETDEDDVEEEAPAAAASA